MVLSLSACSKQDANSDITSGTSDIASTDTTEDNKGTESTPESDATESGSESEEPQNSTPTKPTESTPTTNSNKPTTTTKPNNTEPKDESTTNKNDTPTTSTPTQKPTEEPVEKSYYIGYELVGITRNYTKVMVDGKYLLDRCYGVNNAVQNGDTVTYKINTTNGDTSCVQIAEMYGCDAEIKNDLLILKVNDDMPRRGSYTYVVLNANTKDGKKQIITENLYSYREDYDLTKSEASMDILIADYITKNGMSRVWLGGKPQEEKDKFNDYTYIDVVGNSNWISEVLSKIDYWKKHGCKEICYHLVILCAWDGSAK